jgi:putative NADH-flavin reductase
MKILIFGATGKTGLEVVKQALKQGNEVRAFVRNPQKMAIEDTGLTLVQGDVTDADAVMNAVKGVDGVIVALGASADMQADIVMTEGTANIISAMKQHGVKKVVIQSSYPMSGYEDGIAFLRQVGMGDEQIAAIQPVLDDKKKQIGLALGSGLEFVVVKPMMLTDDAGIGGYRAAENLEVKPGDKISRADVADFMLKALTESQFVGKVVTITY